MIADSFPWKQDLQNQKDILIKYKDLVGDDLNNDECYTNIEKAIFYSAFIIRKLIDSYDRLSDDACKYSIDVKKIKPLKPISGRCFWPEVNSHNWANECPDVEQARVLCNALIHSHFFFFRKEEPDGILYFFVSSDFYKNKVLYKISFLDWIKYIDYIIEDQIVSMTISFDNKKGEYVCKNKKRGVWKNP